MQLAVDVPLRPHAQEFALSDANDALRRLKHDEITGAAVLRVRS
jgi:D-arabinose 1-dehydrogenase-like Zn-dependent alcohol dehydrogenase